MKYIVVKEAWGWQIKEFNGKAPAGEFFKIFDDHDAAEKYIEDNENN